MLLFGHECDDISSQCRSDIAWVVKTNTTLIFQICLQSLDCNIEEKCQHITNSNYVSMMQWLHFIIFSSYATFDTYFLYNPKSLVLMGISLRLLDICNVCWFEIANRFPHVSNASVISWYTTNLSKVMYYFRN